MSGDQNSGRFARELCRGCKLFGRRSIKHGAKDRRRDAGGGVLLGLARRKENLAREGMRMHEGRGITELVEDDRASR